MKKILVLILVVVIVCKPLNTKAQAGSLDASFGNNGKVVSKITSSGLTFGTCIAVQKDGKIIVGGYSWQNGYQFTLIRYLPNGKIDSTFGTNGKKLTTYFNNSSFGYSLKIQDDGRILLAGNTSTGFGSYSFAMARYGPDGQTDYSFGNGGIVETPYPADNYAYNGFAVSLAVQSDGKYLLGGHLSRFTSIYFSLLRYNSNGQVDSSFGKNGWAISKFYGTYDTLGYGTTVLVQPDKKILLTGYATTGRSDLYSFALSRYNENGSPDSTFGTYGQVTTTYQTKNSYAYSSLVQPDNKIVVAGAVYDYSTSSGDFALARYLSNGRLDSSFGNNGFKVTPLDSSNSSVINGIMLQPGGKILACGQASGNFGLVRYNTDGTFDASFGKNGQIYTDFGTNYDRAYAIAQQADDKIVLAGDDGGFNIEIARYNNGQAVLALNLLSFATRLLDDNTHALLTWKTPRDNSNQPFLIERSLDGIHFSVVSSVDASPEGNYSYVDDFSGSGHTSGFIYYRLSMLEATGKVSYSQIQKVSTISGLHAVLFPNPVKTNIHVLITASQNERAEIHITDVQGKIVYKGSKDLRKGSFDYSIDVSLFHKGMYFVQLITQNATTKVSFLKD